MKICIVNFSGRKNGNCHDVAKIIEQSLIAEHEVNLHEMREMNVNPCGKCEYECFYESKSCPYAGDDVGNIYSSVLSSGLAYYIVTNYSDYPNAYFYIFNERSQGIFSFKQHDLFEQYLQIRKKFIVISNTEQENFVRVFNSHVPDNSAANVLFLASRVFDKKGFAGGLMQSGQARQMVVDFI